MDYPPNATVRSLMRHLAGRYKKHLKRLKDENDPIALTEASTFDGFIGFCETELTEVNPPTGTFHSPALGVIFVDGSRALLGGRQANPDGSAVTGPGSTRLADINPMGTKSVPVTGGHGIGDREPQFPRDHGF